MWYVYILQCRDKTLYTGITNDPAQRLHTHNAGKGAKYTRCRLPVEIVYLQEIESQSQALRLEYEIKQRNRKEKLQLITENQEKTCFLLQDVIT